MPGLVEIDLAVLEKLITYFRFYLPLEKGTALYLKKVNPLVHLFLLFRTPSIACYVASFLLLFVVNGVAS